MEKRLQLHQLLVETLGNEDAVYFQEPSNTSMVYPCIVYHLTDDLTRYASNRTYLHNNQWELTLIHRDPDNVIYDKLVRLPFCSFNRFFVANKLNHYVFNIYH